MRRIMMAGALLMGCATAGAKDEELLRPKPPAAATARREPTRSLEVPVTAEVRIDSVGRSAVKGSGRFVVDQGVVTMDLEVSGLPQGTHAVALQEGCEGAHWNPTSATHGRFDSAPFHLGDVGNFFANADGEGSITFATELWSVGTGLSNDVVDRFVAVRMRRDDFKTQPDGDSSEVLGCGRIELSQMRQPAVSATGKLSKPRR